MLRSLWATLVLLCVVGCQTPGRSSALTELQPAQAVSDFSAKTKSAQSDGSDQHKQPLSGSPKSGEKGSNVFSANSLSSDGHAIPAELSSHTVAQPIISGGKQKLQGTIIQASASRQSILSKNHKQERQQLEKSLNSSSAFDEQAWEQALNSTEVVALVNGQPIFAADILDRYGPALKAAFKRMTPSQFQELRRKLIERDLKRQIERVLLVTSLKSELKDEQIKQIYKQLDAYFEKEIERFKKQLNAATKAELEQKLQQQGTSLATLKDQFFNQQLAMEFVRSKMKSTGEFSRSELLEYYRLHQDEFAIPAKVKWQQIRISFKKHGGKQQALKVLKQCIEDLKNGMSFDEAAKRYSDGPTADNGGYWDWTRRGSLANAEVEKALFELPVGQISQVFTDDESFQIVRVVERQDPRVKPFEEVQDLIRKKMKQRAQERARQRLLQDVYRSAVIETKYNVDLSAFGRPSQKPSFDLP